MGTSKDGRCKTCGEDLMSCNGHFGKIRLALPAFHIGYLKFTIEILQCVCKSCSNVLLTEDERRIHLKALRRPNLDSFQRQQYIKKITTACRKVKQCPYCGSLNGPVRKVPQQPLKIVHLKFDAYAKSTAKSKVVPPEKQAFDQSFEVARETSTELDKFVKRAVDDMNPIRVLKILQKVSDADCELLGLNPREGRPEMFIWTHVPAPPVNIRPSVAQEQATTEDDITNKLGDIIQINNLIRLGLMKGQPISQIMEQWDFLQLQLAMYINSDVPGLNKPEYGRSIRGFCQRLKGKQGRFRGNLSGKRVDFSGRTVIGPDPNLSIDEVAVPERVAVTLTYPEKVSRYNLEKLRGCVRNGKEKHPGAVSITKMNGRKIVLAFLNTPAKLEYTAKELRIGDLVERHLEDGDIVLFNRQPSLHKLSILSHRAKIRPGRTFRLNECACNPYNADFDGDEMNLHVPQTEEARTEAMELMGVKHNLITPKNGTLIIAAIQDFISAAYLLSNKDRFYDRKGFTQVCSFMFNGQSFYDPNTRQYHKIEIPAPAILKPQRLWTGKQVFNVLMRPNKSLNILINLDAAGKQYKPTPGQAPDLNIDDSYLVIRNSEVMCGVMDKSTVGEGKKDSLFYVLLRDYGPDYAVQAMNGVAKLSARWLTNQGFSIGISDVYPSQDLEVRKRALIERAYAECDALIQKRGQGILQRDSGCDEEQTMENKISGILSSVRQEAGAICFEQLSRHNTPLIMAKCGSKGSNINVSQMVAGVGQQMIGGARVADGFQDRTLPHFPKNSRQPASKGFVRNSFFSGLNPTEFIFHAMSGREGLVDTAVKTAETGYMSRRLMKSLEDLSCQYDRTVRNSASGVVQFQFGDDQLDPADMEGSAQPVNFDRTFVQSVTATWAHEDKGLLPNEILETTGTMLAYEKLKYQRSKLTGESLPFLARDVSETDEREGGRGFLATIHSYLKDKCSRLERARHTVGLKRDTHQLLEDEESSRRSKKSAPNVTLEQRTSVVDGVLKISLTALRLFIITCLEKYEKSMVQPGHAVGAVGAQSIGEPGTQMTLKTFHFAGVGGMHTTQGVPRIKEIINASKVISTPVINCALLNKSSEQAARIVQGKIEKTYLREIIVYIEDVWYADGCYLNMRLDTDIIDKLQLDVNMSHIMTAIVRTRGLKLSKKDLTAIGSHLRINVPGDISYGPKKRSIAGSKDEYFHVVQSLRRAIPNVPVSGHPDTTRAIINKSDSINPLTGKEDINLQVEGYGLKACMVTEGVDGLHTWTNSVIEAKEVLGIEAARTTIVNEIREVMASMDVDPRHMKLLADVMTYKGDVLGITRFGLAKMRDSVLQLASFEKTPDHLFEAAWRMKTDRVEGVSECIILGQSMKIGTGASSAIWPLGMKEGFVGERKCIFESAFKEIAGEEKGAKQAVKGKGGRKK
ncbi:DNA-directed RNA polymerase III largest subunit [Eremomyces bilateralis CBS 781.70]|uniref:DNA-directed RNA polymerase subunit n=1 Tax=Eremomyces bilateralis CBS 781.70 TaxID=1392243 RepID=A0A6G1FVD1_9PEZI|nr:DNA-directed RNA polymerase III largest subunit [Eremomyces bilateralis CBS 781.70]KAF1809777.1 DNA-directed RNA polymerase III largest subunit [Eremomyces bilateralis CBS 781.70]